MCVCVCVCVCVLSFLVWSLRIQQLEKQQACMLSAGTLEVDVTEESCGWLSVVFCWRTRKFHSRRTRLNIHLQQFSLLESFATGFFSFSLSCKVISKSVGFCFVFPIPVVQTVTDGINHVPVYRMTPHRQAVAQHWGHLQPTGGCSLGDVTYRHWSGLIFVSQLAGGENPA